MLCDMPDSIAVTSARRRAQRDEKKCEAEQAALTEAKDERPQEAGCERRIEQAEKSRAGGQENQHDQKAR